MTTRPSVPRRGARRGSDPGKACALGALCLASTLWSQAVLAGEPDFTRMRTFEAHYAYPDVPHGAPAQDRFAIHAERRGGGWIVEAVGSNPNPAASVRACRKRFPGRTVGPGRLRATDPSGEFGSFELRRAGAYVRLVSLLTGNCARQGLYLVPRVED